MPGSRPSVASTTERPRHVVVTGPMGSGKTTIGSLVADRLRSPFVDSDAVLESEHGLTGHDLANRSGVDALHRLEATIVSNALDGSEPTVIAAAASTADDPSLVERFSHHHVVLLDGEPSVLMRRSAGGAHRRRIDEEEYRRLASVRSDALRDTTTQVLDVTRFSPEACADEVVARYRSADDQ